MRLRREDDAGETLGILIFGIVFFGVLALITGVIIVPEKLLYAAGAVVGTAAAVYGVINMYDALNISLGMGQKASGFVKLRSMLRFLVAGALLLVSILISPYMFAGCAVGLFGIKVSGLLHKQVKRMFYFLTGREYIEEVPENSDITYPDDDDEEDTY